MTRAALILFDDDDPAVGILGVSWSEYRVRQAVRAGAMHIVVVAGRITPSIIAAIDWAKASGVSAVLARTAVEIADLIHPDETVLLLSGPALIDDALMTNLMGQRQPTLLCLPVDAGPEWELIDAQERWTGFARLDGVQIRSTAQMVGDWDLGSTLLRGAVGSAKRRMVDTDDGLWRADDEDGDTLAAERAIVAAAAPNETGWASRTVIGPLIRLAARFAGQRMVAIARASPWISVLPLAASIGFAWAKWPFVAAMLFVSAIVSDRLGELAERATGLSPKLSAWRTRGIDAGAIAALAGLVIPSSLDHAPLVLAAVLMIVTTLARRLYCAEADSWWLADLPGHALIMGSAALFGPDGLTVGLVLSAIHATASLAWLQNRLSGALTQTR